MNFYILIFKFILVFSLYFKITLSYLLLIFSIIFPCFQEGLEDLEALAVCQVNNNLQHKKSKLIQLSITNYSVLTKKLQHNKLEKHSEKKL
jgi:hypothetical protein